MPPDPQPPQRSREEILREIKLALALGAGLTLDKRAEPARGFDPYDKGPARAPGDVWKPRRRG